MNISQKIRFRIIERELMPTKISKMHFKSKIKRFKYQYKGISNEISKQSWLLGKDHEIINLQTITIAWSKLLLLVGKDSWKKRSWKVGKNFLTSRYSTETRTWKSISNLKLSNWSIFPTTLSNFTYPQNWPVSIFSPFNRNENRLETDFDENF